MSPALAGGFFTTEPPGKPHQELYRTLILHCSSEEKAINNSKIMPSGPITSWEVDGETVVTVADFTLGGLQDHCRW